MRLHLFFVLFFWLAISLGACAQEQAARVERPTTTATVTLTPAVTTKPTEGAAEPTATPMPSATFTPTPALLALPTDDFRTLIPTSTRLRAATPRSTATPENTLTHLDLPSWLNNPQAAVLMASTFDNYFDEQEIISFLNVSTGERFDLAIEHDSYRLNWGRDEEGLYFSYVGQDGHIRHVYISSGEVRRLPGPGNVVEAPGGRYFARVRGIPPSVYIDDYISDETVALVDPFNYRYPDFASVEWSPRGDFLTVLYIDFPDERYLPAKTGIAIYKLDGSIFRWFTDLLYGDNWSPDNSYRILYFETEGAEEFDTRHPCILNIMDDTRFCVPEIKIWAEAQDVRTGGYEWSADGKHISFYYWRYTDGLNNNYLSGLCTIGIESRKFACPIDETVISTGISDSSWPWFITLHGWSLDGRYLWLIISPSGPGSDDGSFAQVATVASDGSQFHVWSYGYTRAAWRPTP